MVAALAAAGCTGGGEPPAQHSPTSPPAGSAPSPREHPTGSQPPPQPTDDPFSPIGTGGPPRSPGAPSTATIDDLQTYAYATTGEATLADETAAMAATVGRLATDASARAVEAVRADAETLLGQAATLAADAGVATDRLRPVQPASAAMAVAHGDAVEAFGLTEQYATTATDLATAAKDADAQGFADVAQQAAALAGTSADLTSAFGDLNEELTAWAQANPTDAARALQLYGEPG